MSGSALALAARSSRLLGPTREARIAQAPEAHGMPAVGPVPYSRRAVFIPGQSWRPRPGRPDGGLRGDAGGPRRPPRTQTPAPSRKVKKYTQETQTGVQFCSGLRISAFLGGRARAGTGAFRIMRRDWWSNNFWPSPPDRHPAGEALPITFGRRLFPRHQTVRRPVKGTEAMTWISKLDELQGVPPRVLPRKAKYRMPRDRFRLLPPSQPGPRRKATEFLSHPHRKVRSAVRAILYSRRKGRPAAGWAKRLLEERGLWEIIDFAVVYGVDYGKPRRREKSWSVRADCGHSRSMVTGVSNPPDRRAGEQTTVETSHHQSEQGDGQPNRRRQPVTAQKARETRAALTTIGSASGDKEPVRRPGRQRAGWPEDDGLDCDRHL
jgi:hypothetical protein